jgi:hypothetical protein
MIEENIKEFISYVSKLKGSEKGEAQLFIEHLFVAFGQKGVIEAQAELESPIKIDKKTKFCDLLWPGVALIEMKKRGEKLEKHFNQAKTYWDNTFANRTEYVILCNFDEFWIYNWNRQKEPLDKVKTVNLEKRWRSLSFLSPQKIKPMFGNDLVEVTEVAASKVAELYASLIVRGIEKDIAQRFSLQCLVALFAEDTNLFPRRGFFGEIVDDCLNGQSSYDLFKLLFNSMNSPEPASGGRFKGVDYFNGGIFSTIHSVDLTDKELLLLQEASKYDWSRVQPSIFGNIFEASIDKEERHKTGAHYTYESDIMRIVEPTIIKPWREKIEKAKTLTELFEIQDQLSEFKILDAACGSGNFLYISFRELKHLELQLMSEILDKYPSIKPDKLHSKIKGKQFYGIDTNQLGIELAKITLSMAKKFAADEFNEFTKQHRFLDTSEAPLPFDNLDQNLVVEDALFYDWPEVDAIIGNPPYQSKNKMQQEFGPDYLIKLHSEYPEIPGRADYCVYWFRKAHDQLNNGGRAGLVGTNTITQTYSREGGLDYIISHGGDIEEAISTMPWSGEAVVYVSIVNWIKGISRKRKKKIAIQAGDKKDAPWEEYSVIKIPSSLSPFTDVTSAEKIATNKKVKSCYQGQTHGHEGFLLTPRQAHELIEKNNTNSEVIFPFLTAENLIGNVDSQPSRFVIDFQDRDVFTSRRYAEQFKIIEKKVLPTREQAYKKEKERNAVALKKNPKAKINHHHENFYKNWWRLSYDREKLIIRVNKLNRYIVCGRVTKRQIFEFVDSRIRPNDAIMVFPFEDDYSFGILQSTYHWEWFKARCSTLKGDYRYTSQTVYETPIWPQWGQLMTEEDVMTIKATQKEMNIVKRVAKASTNLREIRNQIREQHNYSLRDLYRIVELPGKNTLKDAQKELDKAVKEAYNYKIPKELKDNDILSFMLNLNHECYKRENNGLNVVSPGLPDKFSKNSELYSYDCVKLKYT